MKTQKNKIKKTVRLFGLILLLFIGTLNAQDKLTFNNGDELDVKVQEISEKQIKFTLKGEENGPVRTVSVNDVFSIVYANGKKELFNSKTTGQSASAYNPVPTRQVSPSKKSRDEFDPDTSDFAKKKRKNFSGPRVGFTYIAPGTTSDYLIDNGKRPTTFQFGWQFEHRLFTVEDGTSGLIEFVPLIGGIDQGLFLPSANFLLGLRGGSKQSWEFAIGPHFGLKANANEELTGSIGLVMALGMSLKKGNVWFPINLAFVPSVGNMETVDIKDANGIVTGSETKKFQTGWRLSLLVGFNSRRR